MTPIVQFADGSRMSITWNLDDQRMLQKEELVDLIAPDSPYQLAVRFRESNALELQQRVLSDMGRVGLLSKMPFTFEVEVTIFTPAPDGTLRRMELPVTTSDKGVCITGRDRKGDLTRLILTEPSVDEILGGVLALDPDGVHPSTRATLQRLKSSTSFRSQLQRGLSAPDPTAKGSMKRLMMPAENSDSEAQHNETVGLIARNPGELTSLSGNDLRDGGVVIVLTDLDTDAISTVSVDVLADADEATTQLNTTSR